MVHVLNFQCVTFMHLLQAAQSKLVKRYMPRKVGHLRFFVSMFKTESIGSAHCTDNLGTYQIHHDGGSLTTMNLSALHVTEGCMQG